MPDDPLSFLTESSDPLSFLTETKQSEEPSSTEPSFLDKLGQAFVYQMQSGGPAGAPSLSPAQAKQAAVELGTQQAISGIFAPIKYLAKLAPYAPRALKFIAGLTETGTIGAGIKTTKALSEGEELPSPEELVKEGALWAGVDAALQTIHAGASLTNIIRTLAKENNLGIGETISRIWKGAKKFYGWSEPKIDPKTGMKIIHPKQIEAAVNLAEKEPTILQGEAELIPKPEKKELTPQQIKNRKIADAEIKKREALAATDAKQRANAFASLGIKDPKEAATEVKEELIPDNPDAAELQADLDEELSPQEEVRAQAAAEAQHMQDKIVGKMNGIWSNFDVEHPFKSVDAPKTGKAVKLYYDTKNSYLEEAKRTVKDLKKLKLSKEELWESLLAAESDKVLKTSEMNDARDIWRSYYDKSFTDLEEAGVLKRPWPESAIHALQTEIDDLRSKLTAPNIKKQMRGKISGEIQEIRRTIAALEKLKYIPKSASLITKALAEILPQVSPKNLRKFAIAAHKKRTTGALSDWIMDQPEILDVLHPYDLLSNYANRKGNDIGLLRIVKSAIEEGLAVKGGKLGYKMRPGEFPALEGYTLHPALYEYLKNLTNPLPFNAYDKISRWAKATLVFDPTYLGTLIPYFRTLIQNPKYLARLPKYWRKAISGVLNQSPEYIQFIENGGASNPFPELRDFQEWIEKEKLQNGSPVNFLFDFALHKATAKDLFNKMADFSWMVDRMARFAYYNMLLDKGLSVPDAAKLAAENFVDYNRLPAKTRRWAGRLFFAPAMQLISIINDVILSISPIKLTKNLFKSKESFKNDHINKERMRLLAGTIMVLFALDQLYRNWGFKREEYGTRYVADFTDEDGKKKEEVLTPAHPLNYSLRWINTFWRGFGPGESSPVEKLFGRASGQINPVLKMAHELGVNKDRDGKKIWDPVGDNFATAILKIGKYAYKQVEPFFARKFHTPEEKKAARQSVKERMGIAEWFMDSIQFSFERKPERERVANKIKYLKAQMSRLAKKGELTEDARLRYVKAIDDLTESVSEKSKSS